MSLDDNREQILVGWGNATLPTMKDEHHCWKTQVLFFFFFFSQVELGQMTANNHLFPAPEWFWWVAFTLGDNLLSIHSKKANMVLSASPSLSLSHTHTSLHFFLRFSSWTLSSLISYFFPPQVWVGDRKQQVSDPFFFRKIK